jgi:hypothetical protein
VNDSTSLTLIGLIVLTIVVIVLAFGVVRIQGTWSDHREPGTCQGCSPAIR